MPYLDFDNVRIAGLACAVPDNVQTLEHVADQAQVKSFQKYTGVMGRHISITRQTSLDLGCAAAKKIMKRQGWAADSIDGIIFLTQTQDFNVGTGNAFLAHYLLGLPADCMAFDMPLACSSFPYGLSVASSLLQQKGINRVLMISGDSQWHFYPNGKPLAIPDSSFMFGEASTAMLLEKSPEAEPISMALFTDGSGYKYLFNPLGGSRNAWEKPGPVLLPNGDIYVQAGKFGYMDGIEITSFSTTRVVEDIKAFLDRQKKTVEDFDGIVLHQANKQIVRTIARRLKADMKNVPLSLDRYGNTSGASVSVTMTDAYAGSDKKKLTLLVSAFGTGLSWGVVSLTLDPQVIEPIFSTNDVFAEGFVKRPA